MTQEQWNAASDEEREAEYERCKDPVYLYNTYWKVPNKQPITAEQWEQIKIESLHHRMRGRRNDILFKRPLTPEECTPVVGQGKVVMQGVSTLLTETMKQYVDQMSFTYLKIQQAMGIPKERLGISCDPYRSSSDHAFKKMVNETTVMYRTYFDKVTNRMITNIINAEKTDRLPRKLKKLVKKRCKLGNVSRRDLHFNHQVYKYSKYYGCKILKEQPSPFSNHRVRFSEKFI